MPFHFNYTKTIQAVAVLLRLAGDSKKANYMRLLKLLYIADRRSLEETGRPITGDRAVAMERGPVLSHVLDLIKGQDIRAVDWSKSIAREDYHIRLIHDPGNGDLCPYEIEVLQSVWDKYSSMDEWELVRATHEFPEWKKNDPGKSSRPIPFADILEAVGRSRDLQAIESDARQSAAFDRFFEG